MNLEERIMIRKEALTIDLLTKMLSEQSNYTSKQKVARIKINKYKFDALMLIDMLDEMGKIDGKRNTETYSMYKYVANGLGIQTMNLHDFSAFLTKYFSYCTKVERFGKSTERIFRKSDKAVLPWKKSDFFNWSVMSNAEKIEAVTAVKADDLPFSMTDFNALLNYMLGQENLTKPDLLE